MWFLPRNKMTIQQSGSTYAWVLNIHSGILRTIIHSVTHRLFLPFTAMMAWSQLLSTALIWQHCTTQTSALCNVHSLALMTRDQLFRLYHSLLSFISFHICLSFHSFFLAFLAFLAFSAFSTFSALGTGSQLSQLWRLDLSFLTSTVWRPGITMNKLQIWS